MNLLIEEPPLQVLPSLAKSIGLNEAIILQQIHYWLRKSNNVKDGYKWIYNSMTNWQKQFSFWSLPTVKRVFRSLEKQGLLITANYNKAGFDKTKWYRINYEKLQHMSQRSDQNDPTMVSSWTDGSDQDDTTNTKRLPETTTETTTEDILSGKPDHIPYQEIMSYFNQQAGTSYRASSKATQRLISARTNEGFTVDDFKKVIDIKVANWKDDPKMSKYLRPATLFGTKFESYLNEPMPTRQPANPYDRYYE
ncbi:conserved phage C-terminal domain-containing protein [Limosilactobacillus fermentum]|uniref:conserved phage C-terminal domain-containing protein n=1 Tax=Limosilactobacillus fermentum TaxID=1613 RepID=UPI003EBA2B41